MENNLELDIIDTSNEGYGVAKHDGLTIFVPFAIEGERVLVDSIEMHKNYAIANLQTVLRLSPRRAKSQCPYYTKCGGCQLMHLDYETQLLFKQLSLSKTLQKLGSISNRVLPTTPSIELEFRNCVQLKVGYEDDAIQLGFYSVKSHSLIDIQECPICGKWFSRVREVLIQYLTKNYKNSHNVDNIYISCFTQNDEQNIQINLQTQTGNILKPQSLLEALQKEFKFVSIYASKQQNKNTLLDYKTCKYIIGEKNLIFTFLDQQIELEPTDFFQTNKSLSEKIFNTLKNKIELLHPEILVDLFCGLGILSTSVAQFCSQIYAIDINKNAITKAKNRAKKMKLNNIQFYSGDCNKLVFELQKNINKKSSRSNTVSTNLDELIINSNNEIDAFSHLLKQSLPSTKVAFLDPSRVGAGKNVLNFLNAIEFDDIFYLSCNPSSLAGDLKELTTNYTIDAITPFDMFPQTNKVETLVHLVRTKSKELEKVEIEQSIQLKVLTKV